MSIDVAGDEGEPSFAPTPHATAPIKRGSNAFATERCPLGTRAEDWNDARPDHATAEPQPPRGSALGALAPATTSASAGSGHPTAPQTRKPRYSAVSQALCRTRTGDPFLTMAVGAVHATPYNKQSAWTRP